MSTQHTPTYPASKPAAPTGRMKPGHWVLLIIGVLLAAGGLWTTIGGGALLAGSAAQQDGRYLLADKERLRTAGYAMTSPSVVIDLGDAAQGVPGVPPLGDLASVQVRATSVVPGQEVFLGIADAAAVDAYLKDVPTASVGNLSWTVAGVRTVQRTPGPFPRDRELATSGGASAPSAPAGQDLWAASASGTGTQEITFDAREGRLSLVVMNADAIRPVWVDLQVGVRSELIGPVGAGLLTAGIVGLVIGLPLILLGAAGLGRGIGLTPPAPGTPPGIYPARLTGFLDQPLSRGLWLVKWLLAIPHAIVLAILWFAVVVVTIAAGFAILFTGRYPRPMFAFTVGVLRWSWRVAFYGYSALGTDRYPPFTLAPADYPAGFDVEYPEKLSRGLVLVKWWLLAIPHWLVIAALTGGAGSRGAGVWWDADSQAWGGSGGLSLLAILVVIAAVILLFTGHYRPETFAFIVGINRWLYRVAAYVLLLRDEYPPFRLDQGPVEPVPAVAAASAPTGPPGAPSSPA